MIDIKNNRLKTFISSVAVAIKLMFFLTGILVLAVLASEIIAYLYGHSFEPVLFNRVSFSQIALFYSGSFIGVLFAHFQIRKDLNKLQSNLDVDLNKISDEVRSLEDKINQIKL